MTPVLVFMVVVVGVAALALAYAAWPHRGEPVPGASWINDMLDKAADAVPVLSDGDLDPVRDADGAAEADAEPGLLHRDLPEGQPSTR